MDQNGAIAEIVAKMRADLTAVGGFENGMVGIPAEGMRTYIERLEAALSAALQPAKPAADFEAPAEGDAGEAFEQCAEEVERGEPWISREAASAIIRKHARAFHVQPKGAETDWKAIAKVQSAKLAVALDEPGARERLVAVMNSPEWKRSPEDQAPAPVAGWDASQIKQPGWHHVQQAFIDGAREARANPDAGDDDFGRASDGYTKRVFEEVDPASEAALRTESWTQGAQAPAVGADTKRLDWLQETQNTPYRVTHEAWEPLTDGSGHRRKVVIFDGWCAEFHGEPHPTIREAIDAAMGKSNVPVQGQQS